MRQARVFWNGELAGILTETNSHSYLFEYDSGYLANSLFPSISLTLPKQQQPFECSYLFPCFFNLLSEGVNRELQCRQLKISEDDDFGLLLATTQHDTVGAITIQPVRI